MNCVGKARATALGIIASVVVAIVLASCLSWIAAQADGSLITRKIEQGFRAGEIQYPGGWILNDPRGIDSFTDCLALEIAILNPQNTLQDAFSSLAYSDRGNDHPCDTLYRTQVEHQKDEQQTFNYNRYWWGASNLAEIALGLTSLSVSEYRTCVHALTFISLAIFAASFLCAYRRIGLVFLPLFVWICLGFGLLILGQSIAHAPEFIVGLLVLSLFPWLRLPDRSVFALSFSYVFLGLLCAYFDLLNGNLALVAVLACCQIVAPYAAHALHSDPRTTRALLHDIAQAMAFFAVGIAAAIAIRLVGYSLVGDMPFHDAMRDWIENFSYRINGQYPLKDLDVSMPRPIYLGAKIIHHWRDPFQGFLAGAPLVALYGASALSWCVAPLYCWRLHRGGVLHASGSIGFFLIAAIVPAWFLLFLQHSLEHTWMTGRLLSLFCGLGMSLGVLIAMALWKRRWQGNRISGPIC